MKSWKRLLAVALALTMSIPFFTGCSSATDLGEPVEIVNEEAEPLDDDVFIIDEGDVPLAARPGGSTEDGIAYEIFLLCNEIRAENNLPQFLWSNELYSVAKIRADEINIKFSHTRPNRKDWLTTYNEAGIHYAKAAENIAVGHTTAQQVVDSWMRSKGHKENILGDYIYFAAGLAKCPDESQYGEGYAFVQLFMSPAK